MTAQCPLCESTDAVVRTDDPSPAPWYCADCVAYFTVDDTGGTVIGP